MKKCYTITLLCLFSALVATAQDRYWVGPSSGAGSNWNNTANWSLTPGGASGATVPNGAGFDVFFTQGAVVIVDITPLTLNSISVTNNSTAVLYTTANTTITLNSTNVGTPALNVDAGSFMRDSVSTAVTFNITFGANARAEIDGDVRLGVNTALAGGGVNLIAQAAGLIANVNSTGRILVGFRGAVGGTTTTLQFNAGSNLIFDRDGGTAPQATYNPSSTIQIIGNTNTATALSLSTPANVGNVEYNSPALNPVSSTPSMNLPSGSTIKGNFLILNTNNKKLALASALAAGTPLNITVQGNFEMSGNSIVSLSSPPTTDPGRDINLIVEGNFLQSAGTFSLQDFDPITHPTTLSVKGNFVQNAGNFTVGSNTTSTSTNLFVVELSGTSNQNVSVSSGTIDNVNAQVALRMNNAAGATLLTPLSVGRMDFVNGILTTGVGTPLTINNTSNAPFTINNVSDASHISGPVRRKTNLAAAYAFPTGKGGNYRVIEVIPSTTTASEYTAEYFNSNHSDPDVTPPLSNRSTAEYWEVSRQLGSDAAIQLTLEGAVPPATASHNLVVARFNGGSWISVKGATGTSLPGNSTSGTIVSQVESSFGPYTFGLVPTGALPIKLTQFDATKAGSANAIHWKAECTSTQAVFVIERSTDGHNFQKIETITADQTRCLLPFDYQDKAPAAGNNFYRIKVVDVDGKAYYSRIVVVINRAKGFELVGVYPSLITSGQLKVNVTAASKDKTELYITNISGQVIRRMQTSLNAGENIIYIHVDGLASGTYQVSAMNSDGELKTLRFIKQ